MSFVAPFAGAWIEIGCTGKSSWALAWSLPSRERGLKFRYALQFHYH